MKNIFILILFFTVNNTYSHIGPSYDHYPNRYKNIQAKNWDTIQSKMDSLLQAKTLLELEKNERLYYDVFFSLARITDIEWAYEQKGIIVDYLKKYYDNLLTKYDFSKRYEEAYETSDGRIIYVIGPIVFEPVCLPYRIVWSILQLDLNSSCKLLPEIWKDITVDVNAIFYKRFGEFIMGVLASTHYDVYKNKCIYNFTLDAKNTTNEDKTQSFIDKILLKYELFMSQNQFEAWEKVWATTARKLKTNIQERQNYLELFYTSQILYEVYSDLEIEVPVSIAQNTKDFQKKYAFTCFSMWLCLRKKHIEKQIINDKIAFKIKKEYYKLLKHKDYVKMKNKDSLADLFKAFERQTSSH